MKNFDQNQSEENKLIDFCPTAMDKLLVDIDKFNYSSRDLYKSSL